MNTKEMILLCKLLNQFHGVSDNSMKGLVESVFYEVFETIRKERGLNALNFFQALLDETEET